MSRHRAEAPPIYRTRHGRVVVLGVSLATTAIALLGGVGVLPSAAEDESRPDRGAQSQAITAAEITREVPDADASGATSTPSEPSSEGPVVVAPTGEADPGADPETDPETDVESGSDTDSQAGADEAVLPAESGEGKRVVFSETLQRVWLVGSADKVKRTYLVSGSLTDNLDPGTYEVYSRSEDAIGIDDSGTMKWFVRFTQGDTGAAIGFHTIPIDDGERVQTKGELGSPRSHGCIRQATGDALALWAFAPLGTTVVVV